MKKLLLGIIIGLFLISGVSALDNYHKLDTSLSFSITSNNATSCNLTIINSPINIIDINQEGTRYSQTFNFSVDAGNYTEKGVYCHNIECYDGVSYKTGQECYQINYFGKELTESQSQLYLGLLVILILILIGTFFGIGFLPRQNEKDPEGKLISIIYLKYLRLPLWLFIYFESLAIIYLSSGIARAFLVDTGFSNLLFAFFKIMLGLTPLIVIILFVWFFIKIMEDKKLQQYMNRGLMGGNL